MGGTAYYVILQYFVCSVIKVYFNCNISEIDSHSGDLCTMTFLKVKYLLMFVKLLGKLCILMKNMSLSSRI